MEEREIKIRVGGLDAVRARLRALGAERVHPAGLERNWVWDRATASPPMSTPSAEQQPGIDLVGELRRTGRLLRLREDPTGVFLTYKGPVRSSGSAKVREEIELGLDQRTDATALLEALGYAVVKRYEKRRERWILGDTEIALDQTPLGDFVEIEARSDHADLAHTAGLLDLDADAAELRSYLALWEAHRSSHREVCPDMLFEDDERTDSRG